ncbi:MAG: MMPL family transporter, partial [Magnetococcales bacterium]|nr:MMPL family transporter [Magnetococcales bacterium]
MGNDPQSLDPGSHHQDPRERFAAAPVLSFFIRDLGGSMSKSISRLYAEFAMAHRRVIVWGVLLVTLFLAPMIRYLDIRNDPDTLLPASNRYVATNLYAEKKFGMGNLMVVGIEVKEGDIYQPWLINLVQEIHNKLEKLPNSRANNFLSLAAQKVKFMGADANGLVFKRLIPTSGIDTKDAKLAAEQLAFLKTGLEENPVMAPMLLYQQDASGKRCQYGQTGCTTRGTFVIADYDDGVKERYLTWVRTLLAELEPYKKDDRIRVLVAGEPYFLSYMLLDLVNHWWLYALSLVIVLLMLLRECRSLLGALFPMYGVLTTIIWTTGVMGLSGFLLTTMMVLTPMLLLAIGMGHAVQVARRFMQEHDVFGSTEEAGIRAIEHTLIPAALCVVTGVAGFATLGFVDISFYKDYAYFGIFGLITLLLTTTTMIPLLMVMFPMRASGISQAEKEYNWRRERHIATVLTRFLTRPGTQWIPVGVVVALMVLSLHYTGILHGTRADLMPGVEKGINYAHAAFKESSRVIQDINRLGEIMPGVISLNIPIRGKAPLKPRCGQDGAVPPNCHDPATMGEQGIFNDADVMADLARMEDWMRKHPSIGFTGSYAQYLKLVNMLLSAEPGEKTDMAQFAIPDTAFLKAADPDDTRNPNEMIALYNGLLSMMTSQGDLDSFVDSKSWNEGVVLGFVNTMDPVLTHKVVADIQGYIEAHKNDPGFSKVHFGLRNGDTSGDTNELSQPGPNYLAPGIGGFLGATEATWEVSMENWLSSPIETGVVIFLITGLMFRNWAISLLLTVMLAVTLFT